MHTSTFYIFFMVTVSELETKCFGVAHRVFGKVWQCSSNEETKRMSLLGAGGSGNLASFLIRS